MSFINGQAVCKPTGPNSIEALGIFVISILYIIYAGPIITACFGKNTLILLTLGLGILPLVYSLIARHDFISVYIIKKAQKKYVLGGLFLSMGMFVFTFVVSSLIGYFFPEAQKVDFQLISYVRKEKIVLVIFTIAILPAICEELLFRGYILSGLKSVANETTSIVLCGLMFGLMHLDPYKIPFTVLIGIGLSFATKKSGSIIIPIFMHGLHNLMLLLITRYYLVFAYDNSVLYNNLFLVIIILLMSFLLIFIGIGFFNNKANIK